jgi:hypothetical protein
LNSNLSILFVFHVAAKLNLDAHNKMDREETEVSRVYLEITLLQGQWFPQLSFIAVCKAFQKEWAVA